MTPTDEEEPVEGEDLARLGRGGRKPLV